MIKDTMRLFFHSVDRDIEYLEDIGASSTILALLRGMQDVVRSKWAIIYSNEKRDKGNSIESYFDLNVEVNEVYNKIVTERSNYVLDNELEEIEPVDEYIIDELFLSYTIFLDAYTECGLFYVICGNFPFHNMLFFSQQKAMREANKRIVDN